jgi:hypothetical protein
MTRDEKGRFKSRDEDLTMHLINTAYLYDVDTTPTGGLHWRATWNGEKYAGYGSKSLHDLLVKAGMEPFLDEEKKEEPKMQAERKTLPDGTVVDRYNLIGTRIWIHAAWTPTGNPFLDHTHSTITTFGDSQWYGRLGTEDPGRKLEASEYEPFINGNYDRAYAKILEAFPEAAEGRRIMGEIEIVES